MNSKDLKKYTKISDDHLKVSEIFASIQGEGPFTGIPSIFLRLSLCNLQCIWCDTPYTWNWIGSNYEHHTKEWEQNQYDPRKEITIMKWEEVLEDIKKLSKENITNIVITGGEPLMHQNSKAFEELAKMLFALGYSIEIETNGTLAPKDWLKTITTRFNVSPKLENSNNSLKRRQISKVYKEFVQIPNSIFKFVITGFPSLKEVSSIIEKYNIPKEKVYLMPEGREDKELRRFSETIVGYCIKNGYNFCNRLHCWVWEGSKRGV